MTTFGWDTSHYDGRITEAIARAAVAEGIEFATAKIGEGGNYVDPYAGANLTAFRDAGVRVLGGYYVPRTPGLSIAAQVDHCIATADKVVPWWRDFGGWCWQDDLELWDYDRVQPVTGIPFGKLLATKTGKRCLLYASKGMYGDRLGAWAPDPLWNANYGTNPAKPFKAAYPGDRSARWAPYSGQTPALLQYGSRTTIAGLSTCDANAYRGTIDQLLSLINPGGTDMALDAGDANTVWYTKNIPSKNPTETPATALLDAQNKARDAAEQSAANGATLTEIKVMLAALPDAIAKAVVAALPPTTGASMGGDFTVTGTVHAEPVAG